MSAEYRPDLQIRIATLARTNLLQGAVHLILFLVHLMLVFAP